MHEALLGQAHRQVAVAALVRLVDLDVSRAVHRLDTQRTVVLLGEEHVVAVLVPVAGALPDVDRVDDRRAHLAIAAVAVQLPPELGQLVPDHHPARVPERRAGRGVGGVEEVELAADPAVIALAGLLEQAQILVQVGLLEEGGAVDPGQHLPRRVAAPVGARLREQLERTDRRGGLQMRPAAQILEVVVAIEADLAVGQALCELELVRLLLGLEPGQELTLVDAVLAHELGRAGQDPAHLGLDPLEILRAQRLRELEVVVEAVGDRRPDRDLRVGPQVQDRLSHHVRGGMPQHGQRLGVAVGDDADALAVVQGQAQVAHVAVDLHGDRGLGQARTDRRGGVEAARAVRQIQAVSIGECHLHRAWQHKPLRSRR